ncbi:hypothetical protein [Sphingobacterium yanglingense]|uniref:Uncharacterized protein n=1 Tax=Sphingobacterium yanglingense TaxID=1437280 RepID=A0A4R6W893_9SPHI|nr:hypothetical protein [Sphingobacterium yanglingense]TDQ73836.1 hypothetical protein CLV99_4273 [Sphingobacterium yanglingense]
MGEPELQNKIATLSSLKEKFEVWSAHNDVLTAHGHALVFDKDGRIVEKLYCPCNQCQEKDDFKQREQLFLNKYSESFFELSDKLNKASTYSERLNLWIKRFGINYCISYSFENTLLTVLPKEKSEIQVYNTAQYNLWRDYYFTNQKETRYTQTDFNSRLKKLNNQLALSPFKDTIWSNTIRELEDHFKNDVNDETKQFFYDLINGKPKAFDEKPFELSELVNYINANEAYQFLCYLHNKGIMIKEAFLSHTSEVLAETQSGMTWGQIVKFFIAKAVKFNIDIPYTDKNFLNLVDKNGKKLANKRTAFFENLKAFSPQQQFDIINELCDTRSDIPGALELKQTLVTQYKQFRSTSPFESSVEQIEEVKTLLGDYPAAETLYKSGIEKVENGIYERNAIDDLRLSLEVLVKEILVNEKSLENQQGELKKFLASKGVVPEIANLLWVNIDHITKYNNRYVKHNDNVGKIDSEMILDLTTTVIKQTIKVCQ